MRDRTAFSIETDDGVRLDAVRQGPRARTPLVLLHGYSDSHRSWEPFHEALPEGAEVLAFSQRGHGESGKPRGYDATRFAEDVAAVLNALGADRAHLVGHSMGAWVEMHFARRAPQRVASLSLIGAFASFADNPGVAALEFDVERLHDPVDPIFVREFQQSAGSRDLPKAFFEQVVSESLRMPAYAWKGVLASFSRDGAPPDLSRVAAPVRLFWGERDPFVPRRDQDILLAHARDASLHVFAGAGHAPHWENPKAVADAVATFTAAADLQSRN